MNIQKDIEHKIHQLFSLFGLEIDYVHKDYMSDNLKHSYDSFHLNKNIVSTYISKKRLRFYDEVVILLKSKINLKNKDIVDVGCGTGHLLNVINQCLVPSITGLDFSQSSIKLTKLLNPDAICHVFDIYKPYSQNNKKYDVVLCTEVLEHLLEPEKAIHTLKNMVNPNGIILITVPDGRVDTYQNHINFWSPESWKIFIEKNCGEFACEFGLIEDSKTNYALFQEQQFNIGGTIK